MKSFEKKHVKGTKIFLQNKEKKGKKTVQNRHQNLSEQKKEKKKSVSS